MSEIISAMGGGVNWLGTLGVGGVVTGVLTLLLRPKTLLALLVAITAPFPGRAHARYERALAIAHGMEPPMPEPDKAQPKRKRKRKRRK